MITTLGWQIAGIALIEGFLTSALVCVWIPPRWFCRGCLWRPLERLLCFVAIWIWAAVGWFLLFAWPFVQAGLVL